MARLIYILDTNVIGDYIAGVTRIKDRLYIARQNRDQLVLCQPVHFEVTRGLLKTNAVRKQVAFEQQLAPLLIWSPLIDADWRQAARFWADATTVGRQLSDVDLLIAALAVRLNATIVSSDNDFDVLPVTRENWRQ